MSRFVVQLPLGVALCCVAVGIFLRDTGRVRYVSATDAEALEAFQACSRAEGIIPAPEANHAVAGALEEALKCKQEGVSRTILFNLCGHGHFDMQAYINYFEGKLVDQDYDQQELAMALAGLPSVAA